MSWADCNRRHLDYHLISAVLLSALKLVVFGILTFKPCAVLVINIIFGWLELPSSFHWLWKDISAQNLWNLECSLSSLALSVITTMGLCRRAESFISVRFQRVSLSLICLRLSKRFIYNQACPRSYIQFKNILRQITLYCFLLSCFDELFRGEVCFCVSCALKCIALHVFHKGAMISIKWMLQFWNSTLSFVHVIRQMMIVNSHEALEMWYGVWNVQCNLSIPFVTKGWNCFAKGLLFVGHISEREVSKGNGCFDSIDVFCSPLSTVYNSHMMLPLSSPTTWQGNNEITEFVLSGSRIQKLWLTTKKFFLPAILTASSHIFCSASEKKF
jgi:hypothetical protein